jgi:hypothetical protein
VRALFAQMLYKNRMPTPQSIWAASEKRTMKAILGDRCVRCGVNNCLTFDCIKPTGHGHHKMGSVARVRFYQQQMRLGNLQLLCSECNSAKGAKPMERYNPSPFDQWSCLSQR